jgi:hypothetical protein
MVRFIVFIIVLFVYFRCAGYSEAQNGSRCILHCGSLLEITLHAVYAKTASGRNPEKSAQPVAPHQSMERSCESPLHLKR